MTLKNKYSYGSKIQWRKSDKLSGFFSVVLDATRIAAITRLNRHTINRYLAAVRDPIARYCEAESLVSDEVVDESYFVTHRAKGIPRRRERGKAIVFGLFKRNGHVHTETVPDCSKPTLQGIIRGCWHLKVLFIQMVGVATVVW